MSVRRTVPLWVIILLLLTGLCLGCIMAGCGEVAAARDVAAKLITPPASPPPPRAELPKDATPLDVLWRRVADLTGELATAVKDAQNEQAREDAADIRAWKAVTRWIAFIAVPLAVALAIVSMVWHFSGLGIPVALAIAGAAIAGQLWAETLQYMAVVGVGAAVAIGGGALAFVIYRLRHAVVAGTVHTDALEAGLSGIQVIGMKAQAEAARAAAGVRGLVAKVRAKV